MPLYYRIDGATKSGRRTAERLLRLRGQLAEIPERTLADTLLLATWNIREFDSRAYGERLDEAFYYIAEIISRFDIVAIQEVREDLAALDKLKGILGRWWGYLVTDVTEGKPGNRERLVFLFDKRKVRFSGVAGEVAIPPVKLGKKRYQPARQLARSPYIAGFQAGWFKFMLCTVHILYGEGVAGDPNREEEIRQIAKFLAKRAKEERAWSSNLILLGDFNIFKRSDETYRAITDAGFTIPEALQHVPVTNIGKKKRYFDQIAFMLDNERLLDHRQAGVLDFYDSVFTENDLEEYRDEMGEALIWTSKERKKKDKTKRVKRDPAKQKSYFRTYWRTHQMSDHLPLWVELKVDFGREYLTRRAAHTTPPA